MSLGRVSRRMHDHKLANALQKWFAFNRLMDLTLINSVSEGGEGVGDQRMRRATEKQSRRSRETAIPRCCFEYENL